MGLPLKNETSHITSLLQRYQSGDPKALNSLMPLVYDELKKIAIQQMRAQSKSHTLSPTALVHEAFLKLSSAGEIEIRDRIHFFAIAAKTMRWFLADHARSKSRDKRGGKDFHRVELEDLQIAAPDGMELLPLTEALEKLETQDARLCQIVELRYLVGLSIDEIAGVLNVSPSTVNRDWIVAKAWLFRELNQKNTD